MSSNLHTTHVCAILTLPCLNNSKRYGTLGDCTSSACDADEIHHWIKVIMNCRYLRWGTHDCFFEWYRRCRFFCHTLAKGLFGKQICQTHWLNGDRHRSVDNPRLPYLLISEKAQSPHISVHAAAPLSPGCGACTEWVCWGASLGSRQPRWQPEHLLSSRYSSPSLRAEKLNCFTVGRQPEHSNVNWPDFLKISCLYLPA